MSGGEVSRRAVLGGAVGLSFDTGLRQAQPLLRMSGDEAQGPLHQPSPAASAGPPPRSGEEWEVRLAAYRAAEAEVRAFERATVGASFAEAAAGEEAEGRLGDVMYARLRRLLRTAAPDVAALAVKLDLVVEHEVGTLEGGEACFLAIRRDARRLAGA